jgi:hypothetical protein
LESEGEEDSSDKDRNTEEHMPVACRPLLCPLRQVRVAVAGVRSNSREEAVGSGIHRVLEAAEGQIHVGREEVDARNLSSKK